MTELLLSERVNDVRTALWGDFAKTFNSRITK